jgi:hypothetical protein
MSELQMGLLAIGFLVVAAVLAYNKWQETKARRRADGAFAARGPDILLRGASGDGQEPAPRPPDVGGAAPAMRVEHTLGELERVAPAPEPAPVAIEGPPSAALDPLIDCIALLHCARPVAGNDLARQVREIFEPGLPKPVHWEAQAESRDVWEPISPAGRYRAVRAGLQLANRSGPVSEEDLLAFCASVQELALALAMEVELPDPAQALARAQALDRFAAEVDLQIGLSVIGSESHTFPGGKIRGLAEASGLALGRDGRFHRHGDDGVELFSLANLEPMPFHPETIRTLHTRGITALFDVPRVPPSDAAFRRFVDFAHQLEQALGGVLVDDNRKPLGQAALEAISRQLREIHRRMEEQGIPAGSQAALRLFS